MANTGAMARRDYGSGSIYRRHEARFGCPPPEVVGHDEAGKEIRVRPDHECRAPWAASIEDGWDENGKRKRSILTAKTETQVKRKLRDRLLAIERGEVGANSRETVKGWAEKYLAMRVHALRPKAYNAAANPIKNWVIPTIGHRRLDQLTPGDIRAVEDAQRKAGRQPADTYRVMMTMLRAAAADGYQIPQATMMTKLQGGVPKSDRAAMSVPEGLRCIKVASELPHGTRWLVTLLYGMRLNECLGLTWDAINFGAGEFGEIVIDWQLQALPYVKPRDRSSGFRVPDDHESKHLVDSFHLVRPKSQSGFRVAPLLPPVREGLLKWREIAPENPWGLVWPNLRGRPANDKHDREEWHVLQQTAEVWHPSGRAYHIHECRNFAATMLLEAGVDEHVVTSLLGHSSVVMSRKYMTVRREPLLEALTRVGERLQLNS